MYIVMFYSAFFLRFRLWVYVYFVIISSTCLWIPDPQELEAFVRLPIWMLGMDIMTPGVVANLPHH